MSNKNSKHKWHAHWKKDEKIGNKHHHHLHNPLHHHPQPIVLGDADKYKPIIILLNFIVHIHFDISTTSFLIHIIFFYLNENRHNNIKWGGFFCSDFFLLTGGFIQSNLATISPTTKYIGFMKGIWLNDG